VNKFNEKGRKAEMKIAVIIGGVVTIITIIPVILDYWSKNIKNKRENEIEKMKYQKEILELEIEKEKMKIKILEEENKNLDKIIYKE
jgi:hypothetical protein